MKNWLLKIKRRKEQSAAELRAAIKGSGSADEVRSLGETLDALLAELKEIEDKLAEVDDGGEGKDEDKAPDDGEGDKGKDKAPDDARRSLAFNPTDSYGGLRQTASFTVGESRSDHTGDPFGTAGYRQAFCQFVTRNAALPEEHASAVTDALTRAGTNTMTTTADGSAVIPTTLVERIISKMTTYGNVWAKVTQTNITGGVEIPILDLKPVATWIGESEVSKQQKLTSADKVSFSYHGLECRISQSILSATVSLKVFEDKFVELSTEAMVLAMESAIISGDGNGKFLGVIKDPRITNTVTLSTADFGAWEGWQKKVVAKIPKAYRDGQWIMEQGTYDGYINGMVDANGQPVARTNYGIENGETYRFAGKAVETVESVLLPSYEDAKAGDVVAIFGRLSDYCVNTNMQMTTVQWTDHNDNRVKTKVMLIADGKVLDPHGFLLVKKGADAAPTSK